MPPRRQSSRASRKETDERLSIAETIAGLATSIEHPSFSPHGVTAHQNLYDDKTAADFARLPSMVIEELDVSAVLQNSQRLPLPAHAVSADDVAETADHGVVKVANSKSKSQAGKKRVRVQSQPSVCSANVIHHGQLSSTERTLATSENVAYRDVDHQHAVTAGYSVSVPFPGDAALSAVMVGWNPPVLATCPVGTSNSIDPLSPDEVSSSPLSSLRTVDPAANSNSSVLKLPLVLEHTSHGMWQLVPVSASEAFGATLLQNTGCIVQTVAQQSEEPVCSGDRMHSQPLSSNVAQAIVGSGSLVTTSGNNSQHQLHSLGSVSCYNGPGACARPVASELSGIVTCSDRVTDKPCVTYSVHSSDASSSEEAVSGLSVLGSLSALRNYYKRISTNIIQSPSWTAAGVQMLNSTDCVASVENNKISCTNLKLPAVSASVCNDPVLSINASLTARNVDVQTNLTRKPMLTSGVSDANSSLRPTGRVLPAVSVDRRQMSSSDSTKQLVLTESHYNLHRTTSTSSLFTDGGHEQSLPEHSCKLLQHLPLKKRQKISNDIHCKTQHNGFQHKTSDDLDSKQAVDDSDRTVDPPDILLNEEVVVHTEHPSSANVALSGTFYISSFYNIPIMCNCSYVSNL